MTLCKFSFSPMKILIIQYSYHYEYHWMQICVIWCSVLPFFSPNLTTKAATQKVMRHPCLCALSRVRFARKVGHTGEVNNENSGRKIYQGTSPPIGQKQQVITLSLSLHRRCGIKIFITSNIIVRNGAEGAGWRGGGGRIIMRTRLEGGRGERGGREAGSGGDQRENVQWETDR